MLPPFKHLWTREKPDGKQGWGPLRWLLAGGVVTVAFFIFLFSVDTKQAQRRAESIMGGKPKANPVVADIPIAAVASSAQDTQQIDLKQAKPAPLGGSQLGLSVQDSDATDSDAFPTAHGPTANPQNQSRETDSIFSALARSEQTESNDGRPVIDEGGTGENSKLVKAKSPFTEARVGGEAAANGGNRTVPVPSFESLVARKVPTVAVSLQQKPASGSATEAGGAGADNPGSWAAHEASEEERTNANHKPTRWLPRGEFIPVYFLTTVQSGKLQAIVRLGVAKNIWYNGQPVLPFGWEFEASVGSVVRDRIQVHIDTLRRRDGPALAVSAIGCGEDHFTGVPSYYIASPALVQAAPLMGQFATAYGSIVAQHATLPTLTAGGLTVTSQTSESQLAQQAGVSALSTALGQFVSSQLTEVQDHYAAYSTIPQGTMAYVQLTKDTDFTPLWDYSHRGEMVTLGTPDVMSTEAVYRALAAEKATPQGQVAQLAQALAAAERAPAATAVPGSPQPTGATPASPANAVVSDPFKETSP